MIVSNGGTAQLLGGGATPQLGSLTVGSASEGLGIGTVQSSGVAVLANFFNIGVALGVAAPFDVLGTLAITGIAANGSTNGLFVGLVSNSTAAGTAEGELSVGGSLLVNGGGIHVGEIFNAAGGSQAQGKLNIGGNAGNAQFLVVGSVFPSNPAVQTGSSAAGEAVIGGNLTLQPGGFANVGTAFGPQVGGLVNQATGQVAIGGVLGFAGDVSSMSIGTTEAGIANGTMTVGALNLGAHRVNGMAIGTTFSGGDATGSFSATSGDLRVGGLQIGTANGVGAGASAQGALNLGGALECVTGGCFLSLGTAGGTGVVNATGTASTVGISGFNGYSIGTLGGTGLAAGSSAQGSLIVGAGGIASTGNGFMNIGTASGGGGAGANAIGTVQVSGGDITGTSFLSVGSSFGSLASAEGSLILTNGQLLTSPAPGGFAVFGVSDGGHATGRLIARDSNLAFGPLFIGLNIGGAGSATGLVDLERSLLSADEVSAGSGLAASATFQLLDSTMQVANGFGLTQGLLSLDDSLLGVGGTFGLGSGATLSIDIDGLLRGVEYGAIDAALAALDGVLSLSFEDLLGLADVMVFDLIRSGSATGISGDFASVLFSGLPDGYFLTSGVVLDGVEVYRVQLARVPEPGTLLLLLGALAGLVASRRRLRG